VVSLGGLGDDDDDVDPEIAALLSAEPEHDLTAPEPDAGPVGLDLSPQELAEDDLEDEPPSGNGDGDDRPS
jgi:hypothetical protein